MAGGISAAAQFLIVLAAASLLRGAAGLLAALALLLTGLLAHLLLILLAGALLSRKDTVLATNLQSYFNELSNLKTWTYPDEAANYTVTITDAAAPDNMPGRQQFSGWLMATSSYSTSSLVAGLSSHLPVTELRLCVGLGNANSHYGNLNNNNGGNTTAYFSIDRLTNLPGVTPWNSGDAPRGARIQRA